MIITTKIAIENFFFHCEFEKNLSVKTLKAYGIDLRQFRTHVGSVVFNSSIELIDKTVLRDYIKGLYGKYKEKSIKRKVSVLKAFFNFLERDEIIEKNPFRKMHIRIREPQRMPRTIELRQIEVVLQHLYSQKSKLVKKDNFAWFCILRDICIIELLFTTGARVSEISSLKLENLKLDEKIITITGKGNRERLAHLFSEQMRSLIKEYMAIREQLFSGCNEVFINRLGSGLSDQSVRFMIRKRVALAGITNHITPHMFRHTFATSLLDNGVDIRHIQELLGHSSILTTQIYTHVTGRNQGIILAQKHPRKMFHV